MLDYTDPDSIRERCVESIAYSAITRREVFIMSMDVVGHDTPSDPVVVRDLSAAPLNFGLDWRVVREVPGEVLLTNINEAIAYPENLRFAVTEIADVFKGTTMEVPTVSANFTKKGASILVQLTRAVQEENSAGNFPVSAHLVLKLPYAVDPDPAGITLLIGRLLGSLYETDENSLSGGTRLESLLRGALTPRDL
jgi:hypothetical protein